jgi:hypothetical protein
MPKPQLFYIGQAVMVSEDAEFDGVTEVPDPEHGKVYHVRGYQWVTPENAWAIYLEEFPPSYCYEESAFVPADGQLDEAISELLTEEVYA